jgi:hypothetical protein
MHHLLLIFLLFGLLTGCKDRKAQQLAFGAKEVQLINGYFSGDVKAAEKSLLDLDAHFREAQRLQIERDYDYDGVLGLTHGRLALLYQHVGRSADADAEFKKAVSYWHRRPGSEEEKRAALVELITRLDRNVKWKTTP